MEFTVPMKTTGAMGIDSLTQINNGWAANSQESQSLQSAQTQNYDQSYNQSGYANQQANYNQQQNYDNQQYYNNQQVNYNNQQVDYNNQQQCYGNNQQTNYNQQNYNQQSYQQPQQQYYQQPVQQTQPVQQAAQPKQRTKGNGVHLKKGQKAALTNAAGGQLTNIDVCLGWDITNQACDLDASAFMLGQNGKVIGDDWFVFYGQTDSPDGSIHHSGDSQGEGDGDDEIISVKLNTVNPNVQKITFVVTINEALERGLNFSMVANAYVRVVDKTTGQEINRFELTDYYSNVTSMVVGELYRYNGAWKFNAVGDGVARDLAGLCEMYGVNVAD
jgi:tellurium resistance protein TerD